MSRVLPRVSLGYGYGLGIPPKKPVPVARVLGYPRHDPSHAWSPTATTTAAAAASDGNNNGNNSCCCCQQRRQRPRVDSRGRKETVGATKRQWGQQSTPEKLFLSRLLTTTLKPTEQRGGGAYPSSSYCLCHFDTVSLEGGTPSVVSLPSQYSEKGCALVLAISTW